MAVASIHLGVWSWTGQDNLLNSKLIVRMGKKGDLSNFDSGMIVGARQAGLSISQSAQLLEFHAQPFLGFPVGENDLFMLEVRGEWAD